MKKLVLALALVAGTMLIGGSPASADDGQFETNATVSVPAGETVTYIRSCNASSSHPDGGTAAGGRATFNEPASVPFLEVVSEGFTGDGIGYFTQVKNTADRGYAYLSWAVCDPIPVVVKPDKPADKVQKHTQKPVVNCEAGTVTTAHEKRNVTYVYNEETNSYDKQVSDYETYRTTTVDATAEQCPVSIPWTPLEPSNPIPPVDVPPVVVVPPVDVPPVVTPPAVVAPPVVEVVTPPAVVKVETPPATVKLVTPPTPTNLVAAPASQPVQEQGFLPDTGGPNTLYIASGAILLAMGSLIVFLSRRDRRTN